MKERKKKDKKRDKETKKGEKGQKWKGKKEQGREKDKDGERDCETKRSNKSCEQIEYDVSTTNPLQKKIKMLYVRSNNCGSDVSRHLRLRYRPLELLSLDSLRVL